MNGGVIGQSNRPTSTLAKGVWTVTDIENAMRISAWPVPVLSIAIGVAHYGSPYISAYSWTTVSGFGSKFSNPATIPGGNPSREVTFNPAGNVIAVVNDATPFILAYPWTTSGFGTKYSNPATLPGFAGYGLAFNTTGDSIAHASPGGGTQVYSWNNSTGFGTKYAGSGPSSMSAHFDSNGGAILSAGVNSPYVDAYAWSDSTGFGTKFSNPSTMTGATEARQAKFSPSSNSVVIAHSGSPYVSGYAWSSSGFGTKFSNPATALSGNGEACAFNPSGSVVAVGHVNSPFVSVYNWSNSTGFGSKISDPVTLTSGTTYGVNFSKLGDALAISHAGAPLISAWPWSVSGFGTKYSNPGSGIPDWGLGIEYVSLTS